MYECKCGYGCGWEARMAERVRTPVCSSSSEEEEEEEDVEVSLMSEMSKEVLHPELELLPVWFGGVVVVAVAADTGVNEMCGSARAALGFGLEVVYTRPRGRRRSGAGS